MKQFLKRLREPSTWAGISALGLIFGLPPGTVDLAGQVIAGVAGLVAVLAPEKAQS
ncbi:hypothetical protein [Roseateles microcysteis]|uniref:hypothetical protein n=1 Tax=Roseateles microcysteis TaxID=3119057 RepID=UPI002FE5593A